MSDFVQPDQEAPKAPKPEEGLWGYGEDRLADLAALVVFRHWLLGLLKDQAEAKAALQERRARVGPEVEPRHGRLFF